jgi:putative NADPH-quinone reductase
MNVLLIIAHPNPESFNHALADIIAQTTQQAGHTLLRRDLYAENFDPVMPANELARDAQLSPEIEHACQEVEQADRIAIVHPNWWSDAPAILRGWTDRCLRAGRAYNFVPDGQGGAKPVGLLRASKALVLNTANTPQTIEESAYGDPLQIHWAKVVFGLCGVASVLRRNFSPVIVSTPEQRATWLQEAADLAQQLLGA